MFREVSVNFVMFLYMYLRHVRSQYRQMTSYINKSPLY